MRIGLISDVHANLPALEAVLDDMPSVDAIVCAGDVVGYNPWPRACLERVREVASTVVQGNHDRAVDTPRRYAHNEMAAAGLAHAKAELSDEQIEYLLDLPPRTTIADGAYRLVHSHPDPDKLGSYVRPRDFPRLRPYLDDNAGIVLGHTHVQHAAEIDGRLIVNPGSVGQPRDGDPEAAYAVLDTDAEDVALRRVRYDVNRVIDRVEASDLPDMTGTRLLDGS
jgi:predicted phosphodiesterase